MLNFIHYAKILDNGQIIENHSFLSYYEIEILQNSLDLLWLEFIDNAEYIYNC